jgi:hypothetical protein
MRFQLARPSKYQNSTSVATSSTPMTTRWRMRFTQQSFRPTALAALCFD